MVRTAVDKNDAGLEDILSDKDFIVLKKLAATFLKNSSGNSTTAKGQQNTTHVG